MSKVLSYFEFSKVSETLLKIKNGMLTGPKEGDCCK
jgi:hypothetical protein